ncbi:unnamed protein product [Prorocentrum cordatum]|uniref:B30.2/SPRY domain-containing protein n=1 Tax=Prorocentrum cordatum TaxID=2364126 RepID=A0ABN9VUL8_9DINO|nr:unnamed protein product [Polarella glacialis]
MAEPPEKKQKTEEEQAKDAAATEVPKAPEPPKELEEDAKALKGAKAADAVEFLQPDTTVNVMPALNGSILTSLTDNGFSHLLAGARASVGVKSGRYMFEVKIVESPSSSHKSGPHPQNLLKIGFSVANSSLLMDSTEASVSFDSEGHFSGIKSGKKVSQKLSGGNVVACLLNLDKGSPNCNTISLFSGGKRISQPQAVPESLLGKALFPTVAFKCMTLHANFGPEPLCPLPFTCHMVASAPKSQAEVKTSTATEAAEVLFPVSLPDEGSFDWLDMFLEKSPGYVEISDRAVREWVEKSGNWQKRGAVPKSSNDKPEMGFGVPKLDDGSSVKKMLTTLCALQKRSAVVMEVKGNLIKEEIGQHLSSPLSRQASDFCDGLGRGSASRVQEGVTRTAPQAEAGCLQQGAPRQVHGREEEMAVYQKTEGAGESPQEGGEGEGEGRQGQGEGSGQGPRGGQEEGPGSQRR